jgi:AcrR family transcriptional regulator
MTEKKLTNKKIKGLETRKRIYDTAIELFLEKGYKNVSVNEIIEESNSSKGGFYRHFDSKISILNDIYIRLDEKYRGFYEADIKKSSDDSLTKIKYYSLEVLKINIELVPVDFLSEVMSYSLVNNSGIINILDRERPYYKILENIISVGKMNGEINNLYETDTIIKWISTIHRGALYNYCIKEASFDWYEFTDEFIGMLLMKIAEK